MKAAALHRDRQVHLPKRKTARRRTRLGDSGYWVTLKWVGFVHDHIATNAAMQVRFFTSAMAAILASSFVLGMMSQKKPAVVVPPRATARSAERPCLVPPRSWSSERLQPWASKPMVPKPPDTPPPKRLLQQRLFKCLTNVYNLGKMEDNASMIAHAREAASLKLELKTYLRTQQKHGAVVFPSIEAWPVVNDIDTVLLSTVGG